MKSQPSLGATCLSVEVSGPREFPFQQPYPFPFHWWQVYKEIPTYNENKVLQVFWIWYAIIDLLVGIFF